MPNISPLVRVLGLCAVVVAPPTHALANPEKILPTERVCESSNAGKTLINPKRAMLRTMTKFPIPLSLQDYDDDGDPNHLDRVAVFMDREYCGAGGLGARDCDTASAKNIDAAREFWTKFFKAQGSKQYKFSRTVAFPLRFEALRMSEHYGRPTNLLDIDLGPEDIEIYKFFIGAPGAVTIECVPKTQEAEKKEPAALGQLLSGNLIVRGKVEDLKKPLTSKTAKQISAATLSVSDNREADTTEYNVNGVVGYKLTNLSFGDDSYLIDFLPYFGVERRFATGKGADNEVENFNFGLNTAITLFDDTQSYTIDLFPQFTIDGEADTKIGSANLTVTPTWDFPEWWLWSGFFPNVRRDIGILSLVPTFNVMAKGGYVFEDGGNQELADSETFLRIGGAVGAKFYFRTKTHLDRFVPFVNYQYLFGASGELNNADRIEVGVNYAIPKTQNVTVSVKYAKGQADETFEDLEYLEAAIGVKF